MVPKALNGPKGLKNMNYTNVKYKEICFGCHKGVVKKHRLCSEETHLERMNPLEVR